jgi:hypothetical protein
MDNVNSVGVSMMTHRVIFDLKVQGGSTEARELELIASSADAKREAEEMLFRAYGDRAQITAFEDKVEN